DYPRQMVANNLPCYHVSRLYLLILIFQNENCCFALVLLAKTLGCTLVKTNIDFLPININLEQSKCVMTYEQANKIQLN
ncbi:hypothetical protein, partial [Mastigocoleus sp. MO_188.B34]|uniref:hypothetical protein n=1 Tax=Mastigocoleus sp. MO_188.B34 TaxID=3036635 RepID=UPI0026375E85